MTDNQCKYQLSEGPCNAPIVADRESRSGFSHAHDADWCHWASPVEYGPGAAETERIFKLRPAASESGQQEKR